MTISHQNFRPTLVEPASFRKLATLSDISHDDLYALSSIPHNDTTISRNKTLIDPAGDLLKCFIVSSGWAYSFAVMPNGRRQVFQIYQEGDFIGFEDLMFKRNVFAVTAITNCRLAEVSADQMRDFLSRNVHLSSYLYAMSNLNHVVLMDRMQVIARMEPKPRMAHFLMEIMSRIRVTSEFHNGKRGRSMAFNLPMRQGLIADCIGMSAVHVSRTFSWFVDEGIISRPARHIFEVHDEARLQDLSGFTNRYESIARLR
jgi:CRP-like cAMP-binding protein